MESNPLTFNNVVLLMASKRDADAEDEVPPPMAGCEARWGLGWRDVLHLPRSKMGLQPPVSMSGLPAFGIMDREWCPEYERIANEYGRRMDMDAAVAAAPEDVQAAALAVRAAMLDGDTSNAEVAEEVKNALSVHEKCIVFAAFCRCNNVMPLRASLFTAAGVVRMQAGHTDEARRKHKGGVDYVRVRPVVAARDSEI